MKEKSKMMDSLASDGMPRPDPDSPSDSSSESPAVSESASASESPSPSESHPVSPQSSVVGMASGEHLQLADCLVGLVAAERTEATDSMILLAITEDLEGENIHVLLTPKTAAILGAALGLACALFLRLIGGPRNRTDGRA
jgi:hypothetical protein